MRREAIFGSDSEKLRSFQLVDADVVLPFRTEDRENVLVTGFHFRSVAPLSVFGADPCRTSKNCSRY